MSKTCEKCGASDFTPKGKCRPCKKRANDAYRAKATGGRAVKAKAKAAPKAAAAPLRLEIDACFGFEAAVNGDGYLDIQQRDSTGEITDTVVMSRSEFRLLVEKFTPWAAAA
jgi:hypothetical protein